MTKQHLALVPNNSTNPDGDAVIIINGVPTRGGIPMCAAEARAWRQQQKQQVEDAQNEERARRALLLARTGGTSRAPLTYRPFAQAAVERGFVTVAPGRVVNG